MLENEKWKYYDHRWLRFGLVLPLKYRPMYTTSIQMSWKYKTPIADWLLHAIPLDAICRPFYASTRKVRHFLLMNLFTISYTCDVLSYCRVIKLVLFWNIPVEIEWEAPWPWQYIWSVWNVCVLFCIQSGTFVFYFVNMVFDK